MKICVVGSYAPSLINFRGPLLKLLVSRGHSVYALAPRCPQIAHIKHALMHMNVHFRPIPFSRAALNPLSDILSFAFLFFRLVSIKPDIVLSYTAKPVIYVGLAIRLLRFLSFNRFSPRFAPLITGLGFAFVPDPENKSSKRSPVLFLLKFLYSESLKIAELVFFQNPDDQSLFYDERLISKATNSVRLWGSGVDLRLYPQAPLPKDHNFLMISRLLVDKGVREYVHAAEIVKHRCPYANFQLAGPLDPNPSGISAYELNRLIDSNHVDYLGEIDNVSQIISLCKYFVLPSYREGTPRSVLEAMAVGRPILTADSPGCRETVIHGVNGYLVPPRNVQDLAQAMFLFIHQSEQETERMANASLALVRQRFDVRKVNISIVESLGL